MCMCESVRIYTPCICGCLWRSEEGTVPPPQARVTGSCEPFDTGSGN